MTNPLPWAVRGEPWAHAPGHRDWLHDRAARILEFYRVAQNPAGGFHDLDVTRRPLPTGWPPAAEPQTTLFQTTRMVHSYGIGHLWGFPGSAALVDHGMEHLWGVHRDQRHGGYFWANGTAGPINDTKQIYGHAFVLLAASTAQRAGHPDASRLLDDVASVIDERFWEVGPGAAAEEFSVDWGTKEDYRGANGNMHLVEALLAAHEATGDAEFLHRARQVSERIIVASAQPNDWRIPEHFHADWSIDHSYHRDVFRPYGSTIGHWLEWSRLLLQLWVAEGRREDWQRDAAVRLFDQAQAEGWEPERGGYYFTVGWNGEPIDRDRYWWPCTEGIAAAHWMRELIGGDRYEQVYRRVWSWSHEHLLLDDGPWRHQLDDSLSPVQNPWYGVPDIYHSIQATLLPTVPATGSLVAGLAARGAPT
jgi:sulfoquinovose isomerase